MMSRRYIGDVDVEVQCDGMIRMDKIKTRDAKILSVNSSILKAYTIIRQSHELHIEHQGDCIVMLMASLSLQLPHSFIRPWVIHTMSYWNRPHSRSM